MPSKRVDVIIKSGSLHKSVERPYVKVSCAGTTHTSPKCNSHRPCWNFVAKFAGVDPDSDTIFVDVVDAPSGFFASEKRIGSVSVPLTGLTRGIPVERSFPLNAADGADSLTISVTAVDFGGQPSSSAAFCGAPLQQPVAYAPAPSYAPVVAPNPYAGNYAPVSFQQQQQQQQQQQPPQYPTQGFSGVFAPPPPMPLTQQPSAPFVPLPVPQQQQQPQPVAPGTEELLAEMQVHVSPLATDLEQPPPQQRTDAGSAGIPPPPPPPPPAQQPPPA